MVVDGMRGSHMRVWLQYSIYTSSVHYVTHAVSRAHAVYHCSIVLPRVQRFGAFHYVLALMALLSINTSYWHCSNTPMTIHRSQACDIQMLVKLVVTMNTVIKNHKSYIVHTQYAQLIDHRFMPRYAGFSLVGLFQRANAGPTSQMRVT